MWTDDHSVPQLCSVHRSSSLCPSLRETAGPHIHVERGPGPGRRGPPTHPHGPAAPLCTAPGHQRFGLGRCRRRHHAGPRFSAPESRWYLPASDLAECCLPAERCPGGTASSRVAISPSQRPAPWPIPPSVSAIPCLVGPPSWHRAPHPVPIPTLYQVTMGCGLPSMTAWN